MNSNAGSPSPCKKQKKSVSLHGVGLEVAGLGILITGASGIGKTTSAMKAMRPGYFWIADDLAVIDRDGKGVLRMTGHRKIKKYLHTDQTGIVEVSRILPVSQIKNQTRLDLIIDIFRADSQTARFERCEQEILETHLPCMRISVPRTGYFNQNLLRSAITRFQKEVV